MHITEHTYVHMPQSLTLRKSKSQQVGQKVQYNCVKLKERGDQGPFNNCGKKGAQLVNVVCPLKRDVSSLWTSVITPATPKLHYTGRFLAPTGALVVAPLLLFHITSSRSSNSLFNLLTLLKNFEHSFLYICCQINYKCWLMLIDMLTDAEWCWLMLIDADWWLMLIDADWCSNKVKPDFLLSERTSWASPVIFFTGTPLKS